MEEKTKIGDIVITNKIKNYEVIISVPFTKITLKELSYFKEAIVDGDRQVVDICVLKVNKM
jgi:hypothetical protein